MLMVVVAYPQYNRVCILQAEGLYDSFVQRVGQEYNAERVKDGRFGAMMNVSLVNDGPVTIVIDSPVR